MPVPNTNASTDFVFAKLHGMWARAAKGEVLDKLVHSSTPEQLQRNLHGLGLDASRREDFHRALLLRKFNMLGKIASLLDDASSGFYHAMLAEAYYGNVKTLIHYRYFPENKSDISWLLVEAPGLPPMDHAAILAARTPGEFARLVPKAWGLGEERFGELVRDLERGRDVMAAECRLDRLYYGNLLRAADRLAPGMRARARHMVKAEMDVLNVCMLLRNVKTYRLKAERLAGLWLSPGGLADTALLGRLAECKSVRQAVMGLPTALQGLLEPFADAELHLAENRLWNWLCGEAVKLFRDFDNPQLSIVAFPFLVRFETLNLGRVYEGVRFGIPSRDMQDMMIGA